MSLARLIGFLPLVLVLPITSDQRSSDLQFQMFCQEHENFRLLVFTSPAIRSVESRLEADARFSMNLGAEKAKVEQASNEAILLSWAKME